MTARQSEGRGPTVIRNIPIDRIRVLNPRSRNKRSFAGIADNIATIGLKRPITVTLADQDEEGPRYDLVCGQGRLEAFKALGEEEIPAIVIKATESECYLMGLIENLARRQHTNQDLLSAIRNLEERGYTVPDIAAKTGLDRSYVTGILHLLRQGEERLIAAVERGWMPIYLASQIAQSDDANLQITMLKAYEDGELCGPKLLKVRRLIERRRLMGKRYSRKGPDKGQPVLSISKLSRVYQEEVQRQQVLIKKAEVGEQRLLFLVTALRRLLTDEHFRTLLRAETLNDLPAALADRFEGENPA